MTWALGRLGFNFSISYWNAMRLLHGCIEVWAAWVAKMSIHAICKFRSLRSLLSSVGYFSTTFFLLC